MPHDFILHCIRISISTLSKYVRENKHKKTIKHIFVLGGTSARYKCPPCQVGGGKGHLYRVEAPPDTNVRHLYQVSRTVQMLNLIYTRWFVPVGDPVQTRVTNRYK
jgi:hypothetical protein